MLRVLDHRSFERQTQDRIDLFPSEADCLTVGLNSIRSTSINLENIEDRAHYLREQLKQSVEILEEDHGKAILVFTLITTIFLPLQVS